MEYLEPIVIVYSCLFRSLEHSCIDNIDYSNIYDVDFSRIFDNCSHGPIRLKSGNSRTVSSRQILNNAERSEMCLTMYFDERLIDIRNVTIGFKVPLDRRLGYTNSS